MQKRPTGEVIITFSKPEYREHFLQHSPLIERRKYPTHPASGPLVFLTVYDAPYELSDDAIEYRLRPFCKVFSRRRGKVHGFPDVCNGLRHYRVRLEQSVPCYMRFGKFQLRFYHDLQTKTCRKCNSSRHLARECNNSFCFNCDTVGHTAKDCTKGMLCCICKSPEHKAIDCRFSWYRRPTSYHDHQDDPSCDRDAPTAPEEMDTSAGSSDAAPPADATSDVQPDVQPATDAPSSAPASEERLLDSQGLFVPKATPTDLPQRPPVVASTPEGSFLIEDLILSDDDGAAASGDDDTSDAEDDAEDDVEDDDGEDDDAGDDDDGVAEDDMCDDINDHDVIPNEDMETSPTSDDLPTSLPDSLEAAYEARPLASAIKRPKHQRKKIGRRGPAKLPNFSSIPTRKPTAPTLFAGRKKSPAAPQPPDPGNSSVDSAPT